MCGLAIEIDAAEIKSIRGDENDSFSRGYHCIKGEALADLHTSRNRLKRPVQRTATGWRELPWDEALDLVARELLQVQAAHGNDAVASYVGNPNVHNYGSFLTLSGFVRSLKSKNRFAATSADQLPHHMVAYFLYGHQLLLPVPDIDRTSFMLILGGNPLVSRGSMMTAPDITNRLKAVQERGGRLVLIDPRRSETAAIVDEHHFIKPGTDAALLLALLHVIFAEHLVRLGRLEAFTRGVTALRTAVQDFTPERAAAVTGIAADKIRELARAFATATSAVCYGRVGVSTQAFGTTCQWLINALNIVTGNLDRPGGAMLTTPALDPIPATARGSFGRWRSRVRGLPEFAGELPVSVLAEEMLTPGLGQVRALVTVAGNPVLSTPSGPQLERALTGLDFMVAVDFHINETTRLANVILPPTGNLEHENYDAAFHVLAVRNTAKYSPVCFAPELGTRHDWQILAGLERRLRLGRKPTLKTRAQLELARLLTPERTLALGLRFGPHGAGFWPLGRGLTLKKLKAAPHGIDLGPLASRLPGRLRTKDQCIDLVPAIFRDDLERVRRELFEAVPATVAGADTAADLVLIGRRQVRVNNSWMGHIERLTKGRATCTALMHPDDAAARGLKTGDLVRVSSRAGQVELPLTVTSGIMPGVVSIPHGFGHTRAGVRLDVAAHAAGVSVNELTDADVVDRLSGNAVLNGVPIRVERA